MDITQTEIDELRRLHEEATKENPGCALVYCREHAAYHTNKPCPEMLLVAFPRLLAALEEARAERDRANGLVKRMEHDNRVIARELDCSWGGSANPEHECKEDNPCLARQYQDAEELLEATATFLERATTRQCYLAKQAAEAERDALKAKLAALVKASQPFANDQGCDAVHHGLADRHDQRDTCPVVARLREALAAAKVPPDLDQLTR